MAEHDLVIRGGTVVDGTGNAGFSADVAIADGRVTEIGRVSGKGRQELDASGALVTPGKRIPSGQLWGGRPARFMRDITDAERAEIDRLANLYYDLSREYLADGVGIPKQV